MKCEMILYMNACSERDDCTISVLLRVLRITYKPYGIVTVLCRSP